MNGLPRDEAGFSLVSAIFLMVVLVALGVALMTLSSAQYMAAAQQVQATRANYAVRAGIEWATKQSETACPAGPTTFGLGGQLSSFTVSVACAGTAHDLSYTSQVYYTVDVTAQSGTYGSPDFVQRRAQAKVLGGP